MWSIFAALALRGAPQFFPASGSVWV